MDSLFTKGSLIRIETNNDEIFEGYFHSQNKDKTKVSLIDAKELPKGSVIDGLSHYYSIAIKDISLVKEENSISEKFGTALAFSHDEKEAYERLSTKYLFINQLDSTFYSAIAELGKYPFIAVGTDCAEMGRKCKLPLLTISTPDQIYIFDIQVMQHHAFNRGLKELLEGEYPKKIIHDCRKLSDSLFHKHAVKLSSVFDTQVADSIIHRQRYGRLPTEVKSLQKCLTEYLGISSHYLDKQKVDIVEWSKRPLLVAIKESSTLNVLYLHKLSEILQEEMFLQFNRGTNCYLDSLRKCDDFEAWNLGSKDKQLPKDFKETVEQY